MTEQWKPVFGFEGLYEVSDHGNVKSRFKQLKPSLKKQCGHMRVNICGKGFYIHRLAMAAFIGPCPDGMEVCHNDGNPANNKLSNLRYGTRKENVADQIKHGVFYKHHKECLKCGGELTWTTWKKPQRECVPCRRERVRKNNLLIHSS